MRVFFNLLRNAIKYSDPHEQHKYILICGAQEPGHVVLSFIDNGIGIIKGEEEIIFRKYSRGSNAVSVFPEGTGLGLDYCRNVIQKHGGSIMVDRNNLSKPTVITIRLPNAMKKILYIDDEADQEKMASKFEILKEEGIGVVPVAKVKDVLPTLSNLRDSIDLIVMDMIMPSEEFYTLEETDGGASTGFRLLVDIRNRYKNIPIIILSVRRRESSDSEILSQYGVSGYLEKPITGSELARFIKKTMTIS
jgi:CheY-like chemotaxis protein